MDVREGRKVSADFHVDLNHEAVRQMLGGCANRTGAPGMGVGAQENGLCLPAEKKSGNCHLSQDLEQWLCFPQQVQENSFFSALIFLRIYSDSNVSSCFMQAIFSVTNPHTDIVMVAKVEKVLMGNIAFGTEPYIKNADSSKVRKELFSTLPHQYYKCLNMFR